MNGLKSLFVAFALALAGSSVGASTIDITSVDGGSQFAGQTATVSDDTTLILGSLTYTRPKTGPLSQTSASITVNGMAGGQAFSFTQMFNFAKSTTCGLRSCSRFIDIIPVLASPFTVQSGNSLFTLILDGFLEHPGSPILTQFFLRPGATRTLLLQATILEEAIPAPVPLPAGGLLLIGALGTLAVARKRRAA
jgi:hypothetical protein